MRFDSKSCSFCPRVTYSKRLKRDLATERFTLSGLLAVVRIDNTLYFHSLHLHLQHQTLLSYPRPIYTLDQESQVYCLALILTPEIYILVKESNPKRRNVRETSTIHRLGEKAMNQDKGTNISKLWLE